MIPSELPTPAHVIEQAVQTALQRYVFAPNDANTWAAVTEEVSGLIAPLWSPTPPWTYTVQCGLGSTMTAQDILDDWMIVQVTLSLIRPAEFIELTIKQRMGG